MMEELIVYKGRVLLIANSKIKRKMMKEYHENLLLGHPRLYKTYKKTRERYAWKGLKKDIKKYIQACITYQMNKAKNNHPAGVLHPLAIPNQKWESISVDFIIGLPSVQEKNCIFYVVDRLTKYVNFFTISTHYKAP